MGGLIGSILGLMFFMNNFSLMAFELDVAQNYLKYVDDKEIDLMKFNIFSYFFYLLYRAGSAFGFCQSWIEMKKRVKIKE